MKHLLKIMWLAVVVLLMSCDNDSTQKADLTYFIPEGASAVYKISDLKTFQQDLSNNEFFKNSEVSKALSNNTIFNYLKPNGESLLVFKKLNDSIANFIYLARQDSTLFVTDSIQNRMIETLKTEDISMQKVTIANNIIYTATQDSVFMVSPSQAVITDILKGKTEQNPQFDKGLNVVENAEITTVLEYPKMSVAKNKQDIAHFLAMDTHILPNGISGSGVAMLNDSLPSLLSIFNDQVPQQNDLEKVIPKDADWAISLTYTDAQKLLQNIQKLNKDSIAEVDTNLFGSVNEIGIINSNESDVVALKSIDPEMTQSALASKISEKSSFRDVQLYTFQPSNYFATSLPNFVSDSLNTAFQLDNFFVFTKNETMAEKMISAFTSNGCLDNATYFENASKNISSSASMLLYQIGDNSANAINELFFPSEKNSKTSKYPLALWQFSYDRNFAHVNFVCEEASNERQIAGAVAEGFSKKLENDVLVNPVFFYNHRTGGYDVAVQDVANQLYLLSESGKELWKTQLDSPILGTVHEVDILKNGKKQLAFVTKNKFYVVDRNGNSVAPFPIKFRDDITQPLSVFDYDNNRNYRFAIVQGKEILLYDVDGNVVKGFTFRKAKSNIILPAQHIRMGSKDYVLIAEENGNLNILNRIGKNRVSVSENFKFSKTPIEEESNDFVVITEDNTKKTITTSGKVSTQKLDVTNSYFFTVTGNTKVTLDDNLMRINNAVLVELPFGIYTKPRVLNSKGESYITTTETTENKVYVYNKSGKLLNGFPVFGTSAGDMVATKNGLRLTTASGNQVIEYSF